MRCINEGRGSCDGAELQVLVGIVAPLLRGVFSFRVVAFERYCVCASRWSRVVEVSRFSGDTLLRVRIAFVPSSRDYPICFGSALFS